MIVAKRSKQLTELILAAVILFSVACPAPTPTPLPTPTATPLPTPTPTPAPIVFTDTALVPAGTVYRLTFPARDGNSVRGSVQIEGGANDDINFWIEDPLGNLVYSGGRVYSTHTYSFRPATSGIYKLVYDNTISTFSSKAVSARIQVNWR